MDGISITQLVEQNDDMVYLDMQTVALGALGANVCAPVEGSSAPDPFPYHSDIGIPHEDIQRMIQLNEGIELASSPPLTQPPSLPGSPRFKHIVKLRPGVSHPSLKRKFTKRNLTPSQSETEEDQDSVGEESDESIGSGKKSISKHDSCSSHAIAKRKAIIREQDKKIKNRECRLKWLGRNLKKFEKLTALERKRLDKMKNRTQKSRLTWQKWKRRLEIKKRGCSKLEITSDEDEDEEMSWDSDEDKVSDELPEPPIAISRYGRARKVNHSYRKYMHSKKAKFVADAPPRVVVKKPAVVKLGPDGLPLPKRGRGRPKKIQDDWKIAQQSLNASAVDEAAMVSEVPALKSANGEAPDDCDTTTPSIEALQSVIKEDTKGQVSLNSSNEARNAEENAVPASRNESADLVAIVAAESSKKKFRRRSAGPKKKVIRKKREVDPIAVTDVLESAKVDEKAVPSQDIVLLETAQPSNDVSIDRADHEKVAHHSSQGCDSDLTAEPLRATDVDVALQTPEDGKIIHRELVVIVKRYSPAGEESSLKQITAIKEGNELKEEIMTKPLPEPGLLKVGRTSGRLKAKANANFGPNSKDVAEPGLQKVERTSLRLKARAIEYPATKLIVEPLESPLPEHIKRGNEVKEEIVIKALPESGFQKAERSSGRLSSKVIETPQPKDAEPKGHILPERCAEKVEKTSGRLKENPYESSDIKPKNNDDLQTALESESSLPKDGLEKKPLEQEEQEIETHGIAALPGPSVLPGKSTKKRKAPKRIGYRKKPRSRHPAPLASESNTSMATPGEPATVALEVAISTATSVKANGCVEERVKDPEPKSVEAGALAKEKGGIVSQRRSHRAIILTPKMADIVQAEAYPSLLQRSTNFSETQVEPAATAHSDCEWAPGDLVWARFPGSPFWPSIVIQDPFSCDEFLKEKKLASGPQLFLHVQFLHERGRRAWNPAQDLLSFQGLAHFRDLQAALPPDSPLQHDFVIPDKMAKTWNEAAKEAEAWLVKSPAMRLAVVRRRQPLERYSGIEVAAEVDSIPVSKSSPSSVSGHQPPQANATKRKRGASPIMGHPIPLKKARSMKATQDTKNPAVTATEAGTAASVSEPQPPQANATKRKRRASSIMGHPIPIKKASMKASQDTKNPAVSIPEAGGARAPSVLSDSSSVQGSVHSSASAEELDWNFKRAKKIMFMGVGNEKTCQICQGVRNEPAYLCSGVCCGYFHASCVAKSTVPTVPKSPSKSPKKPQDEILPADWQCQPCLEGRNPCFVCKEASGTRQMCLTDGCGKFYHAKCLRLFPQTKLNHGERKGVGLQLDPAASSEEPLPKEILACALHTCHTCSSDHVDKAVMERLDKVMRCVRCPTSYHSENFCIPAGTEILTTREILCGKHFEPGKSKNSHHVNVNWCSICTRGGSLICCDQCPSSMHTDCLKIEAPEGSFVCEECESGRFPLYGEIVWVKLASFRWWPSKVLFPHEIPMNMLNLRRRQCEFAVMFFGTHNHQWVSRGRVYLYQEGDAHNNMKVQKILDQRFQLALVEASEAFAWRKDLLMRAPSVKSKPAPYIKIRTSKYKAVATIDKAEPTVCECKPTDDEPCGPGSNCLNRMLQFECNGSRCGADKLCRNQRFEKRQYPPLKLIWTGARGWGLTSTIQLTAGQFIIEYVGEVISDEELNERMKVKLDEKAGSFYFLRLDANRVIDAGPMGNLARFINHSCQPNCETQKWMVNGLTRIGLFAREDIPRGVELTFNYDDMDCVGGKSACLCSAPTCSGFIGDSIKKPQDESEKKGPRKLKQGNISKPKETDNTCFKCGVGGDMMVCDRTGCPRVAHNACAGLPLWSKEKWFCPRHFCAKCGRKTKQLCCLCDTAYCCQHTSGYLYASSNGKLYCNHCLPVALPDKEGSSGRPSSYLKRKETDEATSVSNTDDLVPAIDTDLATPRVLWDPQGKQVNIQRKKKKRTNIPRSKIYDAEAH